MECSSKLTSVEGDLFCKFFLRNNEMLAAAVAEAEETPSVLMLRALCESRENFPKLDSGSGSSSVQLDWAVQVCNGLSAVHLLD